MRSLVLLTCLAATVSFAELDKKQASLLNRINTQLGNIERDLGKYGGGEKWGMITERLQGDFERKIEKVKEQLDSLPADDAAVKTSLDQLAAIRTTFATKVGQRTDREKSDADAKAVVDTLLNAPEATADFARLADLKEIFSNASWWELDHYHFERWLDHSDIVLMRGWGAQAKANKEAFDTLCTKYAPAAAAAPMGPNNQKIITAKDHCGADAQEAAKAYDSAMEAFKAAVPAAIEADGKKLAESIEAAGNKGDFGAIVNPDGKIQAIRNHLGNMVSVYATLVPAAEADRATALVKEAEAKAKAATDRFSAKIVAANRAPDNAYSGADKAELEAFITKLWKKAYPSETILAIRFRGSEFERVTEWVLDPNRNSFVKVDRSNLRVTVIVKSGAEAILYTYTLQKNHQKNGALEMSTARVGNPLPDFRMLVANLK